MMQIIAEQHSELGVIEVAARVLRIAAPRAEVNLIDGDRRACRVAIAAPAHPVAVLPGRTEFPDHGRGARRRLPVARERVSLVDLKAAIARLDVIFVALAMTDLG
jgi:hypothetical protein